MNTLLTFLYYLKQYRDTPWFNLQEYITNTEPIKFPNGIYIRYQGFLAEDRDVFHVEHKGKYYDKYGEWFLLFDYNKAGKLLDIYSQCDDNAE